MVGGVDAPAPQEPTGGDKTAGRPRRHPARPGCRRGGEPALPGRPRTGARRDSATSTAPAGPGSPRSSPRRRAPRCTLVTALADDAARGPAQRAADRRRGAGRTRWRCRGATPEKIRLRARGQVLLRHDRGGPAAVPGEPAEAVLELSPSASAVLVSDYGRGVAAQPALRAALAATRLRWSGTRTRAVRPPCRACAWPPRTCPRCATSPRARCASRPGGRGPQRPGAAAAVAGRRGRGDAGRGRRAALPRRRHAAGGAGAGPAPTVTPAGPATGSPRRPPRAGQRRAGLRGGEGGGRRGLGVRGRRGRAARCPAGPRRPAVQPTSRPGARASR